MLSYGLEELIYSHFIRFTLCITPRHQEGGTVGNRQGGIKIIAHLDWYLCQKVEKHLYKIYFFKIIQQTVDLPTLMLKIETRLSRICKENTKATCQYSFARYLEFSAKVGDWSEIIIILNEKINYIWFSVYDINTFGTTSLTCLFLSVWFSHTIFQQCQRADFVCHSLPRVLFWNWKEMPKKFLQFELMNFAMYSLEVTVIN